MLCSAPLFLFALLLFLSVSLKSVNSSGWSLMSTTRKKDGKHQVDTVDGVVTNKNFRDNGDKNAANIAGGNSNNNNQVKNSGEGVDNAKDNDQIPVNRTATGGLVNNILNFLVIFSFAGNLGFMIYSTFPSFVKKR